MLDSKIILVLLAGIAAGFMNTMAGGGSLLTMPVLIFMGLPSAVANGTNRVALMIQNIIAVTNFRRKGYFDPKLSFMLGLPALLGSIIGSHLAVHISDAVFNKILAAVMLVVIILITWEPHKKYAFFKNAKENLTKMRLVIAVISFFFVGIYGGFIQAGVGFIIIITLSLITGMSLIRINSLKVFIVLIYMSLSLLIFVLNGKVNWILGLVLAVGNGIGAWLGSNLAVAKGEKWIKIVLAAAVILMSARLIGIL